MNAARSARHQRRRESEQRHRERELDGRERKRVKRFRKLRRRVGGWLLPLLAPTVLRALRWSWRKEFLFPENRRAAEEHPGFLVALWHGRMLAAIALHRKEGHCALVSPSDDGGLAVALLEHNGYEVIRGSSHKGGTKALRAMRERLKSGKRGALVVTPDGPRGPRHSVNVGVPWLARATGLPILPLGIATDDAWRLKSWDAFTIPKRRARVVAAYGELIEVPRRIDEGQLEEYATRMRRAVIDAERKAFEHLGIEVDWPTEIG